MLLFLFIFQQKQVTVPSSNGWECFKASFATRRTAVSNNVPSFALASSPSVLLLLTSMPFPSTLSTPLFLFPPNLTPLRHTSRFVAISRHKKCSLGMQSAGDTQGCSQAYPNRQLTVSLNKQYTFIQLKIGLLSSSYPRATTSCTVKIALCGSE